MRHRTLLFSITLLLAPARPAAAQSVPPDEDWRQLTTEHFVITYPDGLVELSTRAATSAERAYALLADRFVQSPSSFSPITRTSPTAWPPRSRTTRSPFWCAHR